jgi:uncharacterized protein (TIGR02145 family)
MVGTGFTGLTADQVKIGDNSCKEISINTNGTALTCTGPTANLTPGDKKVTIRDTEVPNAVVTYTNYPYPTLQSLTSTTCATNFPTINTPTVYRDERDSQLYYISKLADNKCWMLDNLKFKPNGNTSGSVTKNYTATQVWPTTWMEERGTGQFVDPINPDGQWENTNYCYSTANISSENITKCGFLYNWPSATALTGDSTTGTNNATGSICPTNWHLPTGYNSNPELNDFGRLNGLMAGDTSANQDWSSDSRYYSGWQPTGAFHGVFSGDYGGGFDDRGDFGVFWSATADGSSSAHYLDFDSGGVNPGNFSWDRYYGLAVRCVLS